MAILFVDGKDQKFTSNSTHRSFSWSPSPTDTTKCIDDIILISYHFFCPLICDFSLLKSFRELFWWIYQIERNFNEAQIHNKISAERLRTQFGNFLRMKNAVAKKADTGTRNWIIKMTSVLFAIIGFIVFENLVELYLTLRQVSCAKDWNQEKFT